MRIGPTCVCAGVFVAFACIVAPGQALKTTYRGTPGGTLVVPLASEPRTLNPVFALDNASRLAVGLMMADLMHINAATQQVEPALATRVEHSRDQRCWTVHLRHGVRFSDGAPFTSDDVVFTFQVLEDEKLAAPQRDLLVLGGKPIEARALDPWTVELHLPAPYAVGDRLFDSLWMLPRHKLESAFRDGTLAQTWNPALPAADFAGLGPFIPAAYAPARELRLRRNPYYWQVDRTGRPLPYLDEIRLLRAGDANTQSVRFERGDVDILDNVRPADFARLAAQSGAKLEDAGASLELTLLVFNLNENPTDAGLAARQAWFAKTSFRLAVSLAIDRRNLVRSVFSGHAQPLSTLTSPAERPWSDGFAPEGGDPEQARTLLLEHGFQMDGDHLVDAKGEALRFSIIVASSNALRVKMATFIQEDLRRAGLDVTVVPLEFPSFVDRVTHRKDYDCALLGMGLGDSDPNAEMAVWSLDGGAHYWHLQPQHPEAWETELDRLIHQQESVTSPQQRRVLFRQLQAIEHEQLPVIPLVVPNVITGASARLVNLQAATLAPHLLWNAQAIAWQPGAHELEVSDRSGR